MPIGMIFIKCQILRLRKLLKMSIPVYVTKESRLNMLKNNRSKPLKNRVRMQLYS
jgi:hypothetical protein